MIELDTSGFQEMINTLDKMGDDGEKTFKQALNEGADIVVDAMKRKIYQVLHRRSGEGQKGIKRGKVRKQKDGIYTQVAGITKGDISKVFYLKFSEWGSSHEPAKPWMRPAIDESEETAYQKMETVIMGGIENSFKK